jgi:hypothetical protein
LGVAIDADVPDGQKQCARRLAVTFDTKQLATRVVPLNDRIEPLELPTIFITGIRSGCHGWANGEQRRYDTDEDHHVRFPIVMSSQATWRKRPFA